MKVSAWKQWLLALLALLGLVFLSYRVWMGRPSDKLQKMIAKAPDFSFEDENGKTFTSAQLQGKVWVADFIFTSCAGQCPLLSQELRLLQDDWKNNSEFKLVSFSVDPEKDTPPVLKEYAGNLQADENQWFFLTGKKKDLYQVIREGFKLTAQDDPQGGPGFDFIHSTRLVLVDGKGVIRGFYDGQEQDEVKKLKQDIRYLMKFRSKS